MAPVRTDVVPPLRPERGRQPRCVNVRRRTSWSLISLNSTSAKSGEAAINETALRRADFICWQELHLVAAQTVDLRARLRWLGWLAFLEPSYASSRGGTHGGVAFLAQKHINRGAPSFAVTSVVNQGRIVVRRVDAVIPGGLIVATVYLPNRRLIQDRDESNDMILGLGQRLALHGRPFVIAGDWNCDPADIAELGVAPRLDATILYTVEPTCYTPTSMGLIPGHLDFLVSKSLLSLVLNVRVVPDIDVSPRVPVQLIFRCSAAIAKVRIPWTPKKLPLQRPFGPAPEPQWWKDVDGEWQAQVSAAWLALGGFGPGRIA